MRILLLGSGGREHAMAWRINQSNMTDELFIAPGNPGMESLGKIFPDIQVNNFEGIASLALKENIDLLVVGPEDPLVHGITDYFALKPELRHIRVAGPCAQGAKLEGSKDFSKAFMLKYGIPTAAYRTFTSETIHEANEYLKTLKAPYVLKADGLAAGKGVIIAQSLEEAQSELKEMLGGRFGNAGNRIVIEEFLQGIECSVFVACDGRDYRILPVAKDYKRIGDGDTGPNTGGMGAISPVKFADKDFMSKVEERIIKPTIHGLIQENIDYKGFIFIGLMNVAGEPYVIEYNCRLGDPETEAIMLRIKSDFADMLYRIASGSLADYQLEIDPRTVATVIMVSGGYPGEYQKGFEILMPLDSDETILFHAGTKRDGHSIVTNGGRVVAISSYGSDIASAIERSYAKASQVVFEGKNYRHDIGKDLMNL